MDASLHQRIDIPRLTQNLGGRREAVQKMLEMYLRSTKQLLRDMEIAERENNAEKWLALAHSVKGAAQNITAKRMVVLCLEAEEIKVLPHERGKAALYHMHKELEAIREIVTKQFEGKSSLL